MYIHEIHIEFNNDSVDIKIWLLQLVNNSLIIRCSADRCVIFCRCIQLFFDQLRVISATFWRSQVLFHIRLMCVSFWFRWSCQKRYLLRNFCHLSQPCHCSLHRRKTHAKTGPEGPVLRIEHIWKQLWKQRGLDRSAVPVAPQCGLVVPVPSETANFQQRACSLTAGWRQTAAVVRPQ